MISRVDIDAILADPTQRRRLEELVQAGVLSVPRDEARPLDPEANLAKLQAAKRRGQLRWKGVSKRERSRQTKAARARGGGMPRSKGPRCWCGKYTLHCAISRRFDCCKRAGVYPSPAPQA